MSIQTIAFALATILAAYPNASAERALDGQTTVVPRWPAQHAGTNPKLREHPKAARAVAETIDLVECAEEELSWSFATAEAMPPQVGVDGGQANRRAASVRM